MLKLSIGQATDMAWHRSAREPYNVSVRHGLQSLRG